MQEQNLKNHSRMVPLFHYVTFGLIMAVIVASALKLYKSYLYNFHNIWIPAIFFAIGIALLLIAWYTRVFALKAQDRAIRAEENLRYFVMTGKLFDSKLSMRQIIALRFASNNEFQELVNRALKENLSAADIKKAIKEWKADYERV